MGVLLLVDEMVGRRTSQHVTSAPKKKWMQHYMQGSSTRTNVVKLPQLRSLLLYMCNRTRAIALVLTDEPQDDETK